MTRRRERVRAGWKLPPHLQHYGGVPASSCRLRMYGKQLNCGYRNGRHTRRHGSAHNMKENEIWGERGGTSFGNGKRGKRARERYFTRTFARCVQLCGLLSIESDYSNIITLLPLCIIVATSILVVKFNLFSATIETFCLARPQDQHQLLHRSVHP